MSIKSDDLLGTGFGNMTFVLPDLQSGTDEIIGVSYLDMPALAPPPSLSGPVPEMGGVANVVIGNLLNTDNVSDTSALNLNSAWGIHALEFGGTTYVYASGQLDNGFSIFEMDSNGDLTHLANVDDNVATALTGARQIQTLDIGGTTYMYVSAGSGAINVFSVDPTNGMPTFIEAVVDNGALNLINTAGRMSFVEVGAKTFLVASAFNDDGLSVFEIGNDGRLIANTDNVSDPTNLNAAYDTATIEVGGNDYVFVASAGSDNVTSYQVNANGDLIFADRVSDTAGTELNDPVGLATTTLNGTEFLFVSGFLDDGISVFSIDSTGGMTNVSNFGDSVNLNGSHGLEIIEFAGETFLAAVSRVSDNMTIFHVSSGGALTRLDNATTSQLNNAIYVEGLFKDGNPFLIGTGLDGDGISVFEIGGGNDNLTGTTTAQDLVLGLRGDDIIRPQLAGPTGDIYDGGEGIDSVNISGNNADYTVDLLAGVYFTTSNPSITVTLQDFENILGGNGDDTLIGDAGDNRIESGSGSDIIDGGAGSDTFIMRGQANDVTGGDGDDTFIVINEGFSTTGNTYRGGAGFDTLDITALAPGAGISLFVSSIEQLLGASYGDTWFGTSGNDIINGNGGNDNLSGGFGDDEIYGGADNDTLDGGSGADIIYGNSGDDIIAGGSGADELYGGTGINTLLYTASTAGVTVDLTANTASGGYAEGDIISLFDNIEGSAFDDVLTGTSGVNIMTGGNGADTIYGGFGDDVLNGGDGDDVIDGGIAGGSTVQTGNDTINGGDGDDMIIYSYSATGPEDIDTVDGGAGIDTYVMSVLTLSGRTVDLTAGTLVWNGTLRGTLTNIENVTVNGPVTVIGDGNDNVIIGTSTTAGNVFSGLDGNDTINGGGGDDTLDGGNGDDFLDGGAGIDTVNAGAGDDMIMGSDGADNIDGGADTDEMSYLASLAGVTIDLLGNAGVGGYADGDVLLGIENLIGSNFDDTLTGDALDNIITGVDGDDVLNGGDGNDTLIGGLGDDILNAGDGDDILIGGAGADDFSGGAGIDIVDYSASSAGILINLNSNFANFGDATGDSFADIEHIIGSDFDDTITGSTAGDETLIGGAGNDTLRGVGGDDVLEGGAGDDTLEGGGADDILLGGAGADVLNGATGRDIASYATSSSRVIVNLISGTAAQGDATGDTLIQIEDLIGSEFDDVFNGTHDRSILYGNGGNDNLRGRGGRDDLYGEEGDDFLEGGGAADRLDGGAGNDTLNGGASRDVFVFSNGFGQDIIEDFVDDFDQIDFSAHTAFNTFTDVTVAAVQFGADVVIQDGANMITIQNFNLADLDAVDFIF